MFFPKVKVKAGNGISISIIEFRKGSLDIIKFPKDLTYVQIGKYYLWINRGGNTVPRRFITDRKRSPILSAKNIQFGKTTKPFKIKEFLEANDAVRRREELLRQEGPLLRDDRELRIGCI